MPFTCPRTEGQGNKTHEYKRNINLNYEIRANKDHHLPINEQQTTINVLKTMFTLMYHDVIEPGMRKDSSGLNIKGADAYKISKQAFEAQVSAAAAIRKRTRQEILFSFDDGGISGISVVAPVLEKYDFRGLFFIPTAFMGEPGFLGKKEIAALHKQGHIIGSHSHRHQPMMNRLPYDAILKEWEQSCKILRRIIKEKITIASVPGGWYAPVVAQAAARAGINTLYTSKPVIFEQITNGCTITGRFAVRENMGPSIVKSLIEGTNFVRERMLLKWRAGQAVKRFY